MIENKRKKILNDFITVAKYIFGITTLILLAFLFLKIEVYGLLIIISIFVIGYYYYVFSTKYTKEFQQMFFNKLKPDENFNDINFELGENKFTREDAMNSELFEVYNFESTNLLTYNYKKYSVKITDAKSATTGKHKRTYTNGLFAVVNLNKSHKPLFVTNNSKSFELFFSKLGNKLFPKHVDVKLQKFEINEKLSINLNAYSSDEKTFKLYFNNNVESILLSQFLNESSSHVVEYSIVGKQLFIMMNSKHFNLQNRQSFLSKYDDKIENPEQKIELLKIFLNNNVNKIIEEISKID
jgi:hypothetical protein